MKYLLVVFGLLMSSIPGAAQTFQSVRPTYVVPSVGTHAHPVTVWSGTQVLTPQPSWVIVRPTVPPPPLVVPPVRLPPLLLFQTTRGLRGFIIEPPIVLPIGGQTPSIFTPTWGLWDPR